MNFIRTDPDPEFFQGSYPDMKKEATECCEVNYQTILMGLDVLANGQLIDPISAFSMVFIYKLLP